MKPIAVGAHVGIVTVTYNSGRFLDEFFASCERQTLGGVKVYAIDNASADDSAERLRARAATDSRLEIIVNRENLGVAAGNNQGILRALEDGCDWVLLLNNDTAFPPDMLAQLLRAAAENRWLVVVPKIFFDTPRGHIWYGGGGFNPRRGHTGYHVGIGEPDRSQYDTPHTVDYSPTCAMLVYRNVFGDVGLMDETYFVYFDDTDFCWRLRERGIAIGYWPGATLTHKVGGSTGGGSSFTARITARNRLYFLKKHFGPLSPVLWRPVFLVYYAARYLLASRNPAAFRASVAGSFAYRGLKPHEPALGARNGRS